MPHKKGHKLPEVGEPILEAPPIEEFIPKGDISKLFPDVNKGGGEAPPPEPKPPQEGIFQQGQTGRPSGISVGGRTFLGLSPEDVARFQQQQGIPQQGQGALAPFGDPAQALLREQEQAEFQRGRDIPLGAFEGLDSNTANKFLVQGLINSPFGQALLSREGLDTADLKQLKKMTDRMIEQGLTPEQVTADPFLQSMLRLELNETDLKILKQGDADVSAFSQFVEGIPFIGSLARKYAGEMIPTASRRSDNILAEITDIESSTTKWREATSRNPQQVPRVKVMTQEALDRLLELEAINKMLIIQSPILQSNPEEVNTILSKIDSVKVNLQNRIQELEFSERFPNVQQ